jgi:hypothetical protein
MIGPKFSWNEYFSGSPTTTLNGSKYGSQLSYTSGSVYVLNCLFNRITSGSNGGALYCNPVTFLLIESSSFFTCSTSAKYGGAIYFRNTNSGESVLYEVCGYDCYSTCTSDSPHDQFAFIFVNDVVSKRNHFNYSSITRCGGQNPKTRVTIRLNYGKVCFPSVNISNNKCNCYSGIYSIPFCDPNTVTFSLSYSTFADNNAYDYSCLYLTKGDAKYEIKSCNILRNTQVSSSYGIISTWGNLNIEDSCILGNSATNVFYSSSSSYTITLTRCIVDNKSNNGYLTIQSAATKSFILGLSHMSTLYCHSEYDSVGYLTPIPDVSQTTNKIFCHTCDQRRNNYLFSLHWVFVFTFIHPNPSCYC